MEAHRRDALLAALSKLKGELRFTFNLEERRLLEGEIAAIEHQLWGDG